MSFLTGTNTELVYISTSVGTAKNTFTTEVQINDTAGMGVQAHIPPDFWLPNPTSLGKAIRVVARGILSTTGDPTFTFTLRLGSAGSITSAIVLGSAAITAGTTVTNQIWEFDGEIVLTAIGAAGTNSTIRGIGTVTSSGFASPFTFPLYGGAASPGTVATVDTSVANYFNFNVACNTSSVSNSVQIQQLMVQGLN
jgi:hypothetical protein